MNNLCTLYSSHDIKPRLLELIHQNFKNPKIDKETTEHGTNFKFTHKKGLFKGKTDIIISTRQREIGVPLVEDDSPLATNLVGMRNFVLQITSAPPIGIKNLNTLIENFSSETGIQCSDEDSKELFELVKAIALEKECVLFSQSDTFIGKGNYPHFLGKNLELLLDVHGNSEVYLAAGPLEAMEEEEEPEKIYPDQLSRKENSILKISKLDIPTIDHLPCVESENNVVVRSTEEIASRAVILAITNLVAFGNLTGIQANEMISKYALGNLVTPDEKNFLESPTEVMKTQMTWRCEGIWTLCWALGIVDDLGPADVLADLGNIDNEKYPIALETDPNIFIQQQHQVRNAKEILDQTDLYYRLNWACVDARLNGREITKANQGVVYERQYALNWLVNYMDQDWDDITCDT